MPNSFGGSIAKGHPGSNLRTAAAAGHFMGVNSSAGESGPAERRAQVPRMRRAEPSSGRRIQRPSLLEHFVPVAAARQRQKIWLGEENHPANACSRQHMSDEVLVLDGLLGRAAAADHEPPCGRQTLSATASRAARWERPRPPAPGVRPLGALATWLDRARGSCRAPRLASAGRTSRSRAPRPISAG